MTYRATRPPQQGGWDLLKEWASREFSRLQQALQRSADVEEGVFTPTLDFATTGDLSNSYADQTGYYWRIGPLVHFSLLLTVTPTHSTASGNMEIGGLPYTAKAGQPSSVVYLYLSGSGLTWGTGRTSDNGLVPPGTNYVQVITSGTGTSSNVMDATEVASATQFGMRASGFYPIK